MQRKFKNQTDTIRPYTEISKIHQSLLQKKVVLWMRQTKQVEQEVTPTNIFLNVKTGSYSEASSSEEEDVGMRKGRRKSDFENTNEELNGSTSEEEEINSPK